MLHHSANIPYRYQFKFQLFLGDSRGWLESLSSCTHLGDLEEAHGCELQIGTALAIVLLCKVIQWMERERSFSLILSL